MREENLNLDITYDEILRNLTIQRNEYRDEQINRQARMMDEFWHEARNLVMVPPDRITTNYVMLSIKKRLIGNFKIGKDNG